MTAFAYNSSQVEEETLHKFKINGLLYNLVQKKIHYSTRGRCAFMQHGNLKRTMQVQSLSLESCTCKTVIQTTQIKSLSSATTETRQTWKDRIISGE